MRFSSLCTGLVAVCASFAVVQTPSDAQRRSGGEAFRPIVIAHRGASGYLPEHTLEAYAVAHAMGADYVEPDLVMTRDKRLICLHDIHLDSTTDVETKFPDRARADGRWYAADFTLAEIKQLAAQERLPNRFPQDSHGFQIPTFEEMIELVQGLNARSGRNVGIYPELKAPTWHLSQGLPMERAVIDVLTAYGYTEASSPVFLQCFELQPLQMIRGELKSPLNLILLVGGGRDAQTVLTEAGLASVARFANGIGPDKRLVENEPRIVQWAHENGLAVHPYTFRADSYNSTQYESDEAELRQFLTSYKIDGFFTDFPDRGAILVDALFSRGSSRSKRP